MSYEIIPAVNTEELDKELIDVANNVLASADSKETKDLVSAFNWNMSKKNVARILKLNKLLDSVSDQMELRLTLRADQFSNSDLLDYMKAIQGAIDTSTKTLAQVDETTPMIQNNTQINVNMVDKVEFTSESREKILAAVEATLAAMHINNDPDLIEVEPADPDQLIENALEEFSSALSEEEVT